jgi:glycosyltransferase involved in cell wall biosynthesis
MPKISAVICTYNRYAFLDKAIESVLAQDLPANDFDIYVIDNSPAGPDRTRSSSRWQSNPRVRYITVDTPGLSNARNVALKETKSTYIAYLDDDATASPQWLRLTLAAFGSAENVGVVGGAVEPDFAAPRPAWLHDKLMDYLSVLQLPGDKPRLFDTSEAPVGANIAFNCKVLRDIGGFNVSLGRSGSNHLLSGEESAVFEAIKKKGHALVYSPGASVRHHIPAERLTHAFFRKRAGWQAVTWEVMNSPFPPAAQAVAWGLIGEYVKAQPQGLPMLGLMWDVEDPNVFLLQIRCYEFFIRLMLMQGKLPT